MVLSSWLCHDDSTINIVVLIIIIIIYQIKVFEWKTVEALDTVNLVVSQTEVLKTSTV